METIVGTNIARAKEILEQGSLVAIPTETVYGLAANALKPEAVVKIFEAKNRPQFNPLIVHCKSWASAMDYTQDVPAIAQQLAEHFSPGAITFLLPKKNTIPDIVTAGSDLVAIRIPNHPMSLALLSQVDFPLAAPSANPFGYISPTSAAHVLDSLTGKIEYILDGGNAQIGLESTIVGFDDQEEVLLHRVGGVAIEDIERVIGKKVIFVQSNPNKPQSSGQLKSHYAPHTDLLIGDIAALYQQFSDKKIGLMSLSNLYPQLHFAHRLLLSPSGNLAEAAQNLFSFLRQLDELDLDIILVEKLPNEGLGRAINDRLNRAQAIYK